MGARAEDLDCDGEVDGGPLRQCAVSRAHKPPEELIRFVAGPDGAIVPDLARRLPGRVIKPAGRLREKVTSALPFALTASQRQALAEIGGDMASATRMLRLLQGDVGSGKTVVALLAMLDAVEAGGQAATPSFVKLDPVDPTSPRLKALVEALNAVHAPTEDIIEIIKGLDRDGKLHAQLVIE